MENPLKFPPRAVLLIGQPLTVHPEWILIAPITCNCEAKTPLTVKLGQNIGPSVCMACLNIYGVTRLRYDPVKNIGFEMEIGVIGKAQREVSDADVAAKIMETAH